MRVAWRLTPAARSHQQMIKLHVKDGPLLQQHKPRRPPATYGRLDGNGSPDGEVSRTPVVVVMTVPYPRRELDLYACRRDTGHH